MRRKRCLVMCRTGMGSSMMLKIQIEKVLERNGWDMDVTHDAADGFMGQQGIDVIVTMSDLIEDFRDSKAFLIGVHDITDTETLEREFSRFFASEAGTA